MRLNKIILLGILLISVLFVSGCVNPMYKIGTYKQNSSTIPVQTSDEGEVLQSRGISTTTEQPTSDVSGEDISDIPRYITSVRIFYGKDILGTISGTTVVGYLTSASIDTVLDFYQAQLPANGWAIIDAGEVSKMVAAMKEERGSVIVTITASEDYSGYTDINIVFVP